MAFREDIHSGSPKLGVPSMAVDYKASSSVKPNIIGPPLNDSKMKTDLTQPSQQPQVISTNLSEIELRTMALNLAVWKTYRTAASGDQSIQLAERMLNYIKTGTIPK